jgi:Flp pilus assembly pilin Flp
MRKRVASRTATAVTPRSKRERLADDTGASLVEYAFIMALVSVVAFGALILLGNQTSTLLNASASSITS